MNNFKKWLELQESMTSTADVSHFVRPTIPSQERDEVDEFFKKKKNKNK